MGADPRRLQSPRGRSSILGRSRPPRNGAAVRGEHELRPRCTGGIETVSVRLWQRHAVRDGPHVIVNVEDFVPAETDRTVRGPWA